MKSYTTYKKINLPWLKEIPSLWDIVRNKNIFVEMKDEVGDKFSEYTLLSLSLKGIIPRDVESGKGKFPDSFEKYKIVRPGYMVFCLFDMDETPRTVGYSKLYGMVTGAYKVFDVLNINIKYAYYYYLSLDNIKALRPFYTGLRKVIKIDTFLSIKMPRPSFSEQDQIVCFLDWKISSINRLIKNYKKEISILSELKDGIINQATIKGLRNTECVHQVDDRWDIEYPNNWSIHRMREFFNFRKGLSITKKDLKESGIPVISYGQIHSKKNSGVGVCNDLFRFVSPTYLNKGAGSVVTRNDFIFADTSEDLEGCGNCAFIDCDDTIFAGYHTIIAHTELSGNIKYFAYLFKSAGWRNQIRKKVNEVKVYSITQAILKDVFFLIPPQDEQDEIVEYLDRQCSSIDRFTENLEKKIQQLKDMKVALISDVVTGKIDVRNVEIPEYERVEEDFTEDDSSEMSEEIEKQED